MNSLENILKNEPALKITLILKIHDLGLEEFNDLVKLSRLELSRCVAKGHIRKQDVDKFNEIVNEVIKDYLEEK